MLTLDAFLDSCDSVTELEDMTLPWSDKGQFFLDLTLLALQIFLF